MLDVKFQSCHPGVSLERARSGVYWGEDFLTQETD